MLEIDHLGAGYGKTPVLHDISMRIETGEVVCVIGPNGAGKTTLLRTIAGALQPTSGFIRFDGREVQHLPPYEIARLGIVLVPEGKRVFPTLTVAECLRVASHSDGGPLDEKLEEIFGIFPRLRARTRQLAGTLSGGERQMLAVAMGLMARPKLLLLDEPSHGLAPALVEEMFERIVRISHGFGLTVLLVEQLVLEALSVTDRGYVISNGQLVTEGRSADLLGNQEIRDSYLGTRAMLAARQRPSASRR